MIALYVFLRILVVCLPAQEHDQVVLHNTSGQPNGLIVWGKFSLTQGSQVFQNQPATIDIGDVHWGLANELVAFTADRAPAFTKFLWTLGTDTADATYPGIVLLRVRVWVLCPDAACGPLTDDIRLDIITKLAGANDLFTSQTAGIRLNLDDPNLINDRTNDTVKKSAYADFDTTAQCSQVKDLVDGILDKSAMNLYIVRIVDHQFGRGNTCFDQNVAVFGYLLNAGLIAHELGHNHGLFKHAEYYPELQPLGTKNIMHSLSNVREYLSEGEVYRMHFERQSVLNWGPTYFSIPPVPRPEARSCAVNNALKPCVPIGTRLWPDP